MRGINVCSRYRSTTLTSEVVGGVKIIATVIQISNPLIECIHFFDEVILDVRLVQTYPKLIFHSVKLIYRAKILGSAENGIRRPLTCDRN